MKLTRIIASLTIFMSLFISDMAMAQTTITIGEGGSSSSTRGPLQRSDTASATVFSRWVQMFTESELTAAGVTSGVSISQLNWEIASSNVIIGAGDANVKIYVRNSSAAAATEDTWDNYILGSDLVFEDNYNTTNNFPGENGWMPFEFDTSFTYTGGTLEVAVDWDCSQISTPAFSGDGSLKWRWESVAPDFLVVKKTSSSGPSSTLTDLRDERANIQMVYSAAGSICAAPSSLNVSEISTTGADVSWSAAENAVSYSWKVVLAGEGSDGTAVASGSTMNTMDAATGLTALTAYDLFVQTECAEAELSDYEGPFSFATLASSSTIMTVGLGTSSSSTRGPFQRSDTSSTTVFSRFVHLYTAAELTAGGITNDNIITALNWELASSNIIIGDGNANLKVYIKNSSATETVSAEWTTQIDGSTLVVDNNYNTTNNFPGENGWMPFDFSTPFVYTGDAVEVAVDWDCSAVSTPAFSGDGSLKWRWESTAPDFLVVKKTSNSSPSSEITDLRDERANIQFVYSTGETEGACAAPSGLITSELTMSSAVVNWDAVEEISSYNWILVAGGEGVTGTAIDQGTTSELTASISGLEAGTAYDFYVESDCGDDETSGYSVVYSIVTVCAEVPFTISSEVTNVLCNGSATGVIDLTVADGVEPYSYVWSNDVETEDVDGLAAGDYSVNIFDANDCLVETSFTVTELEALELTTSGVDDIEEGGTGSASVVASGGTEPYTYAWDGTAGDADLTGLTMGTYEVVVTDSNGCSAMDSVEVDNIVGVLEIDYLSKLSISPNPSSGISVLELDLVENADLGISIYSMNGKLIQSFYQKNVNQLVYSLDLSSYSEGVYFVQLAIENQTFTKRLVILK